MSAKYGKISREDFIEKLGRTEEEADILVRAQEAFPELTTGLTGQKGFVIDARVLWTQLGEPHSRFNLWIKRSVIDKPLTSKLKNTNLFLEDKDYEVYVNENGNWVHKNVHLERQGIEALDGKRLSQLGYSVEYKLTMDCAKNIALMEGTLEGHLCRQYFILMEEAIRDLQAWDRIRNPQRYGYNQLKISVTEWYNENKDSIGKPLGLVMAEECNMIYLAVTGYTCKGLKKELGLHSRDSLRDNLPTEVNSAICNMQDYDRNLIDSGYDFEKRRDALFAYCDKRLEHLRYGLKSNI